MGSLQTQRGSQHNPVLLINQIESLDYRCMNQIIDDCMSTAQDKQSRGQTANTFYGHTHNTLISLSSTQELLVSAAPLLAPWMAAHQCRPAVSS